MPPGGTLAVEPHAAERMAEPGLTEAHVRWTLERPGPVSGCSGSWSAWWQDPVLPPGGALAVEPHAAERMAELGITEVRVNEAGGILCLQLPSVPIALSRESWTARWRRADGPLRSVRMS